MNRPLIIGHRGASFDAPENTLAAFRLAFAQGADGIEADFRLSADGEILCIHDATTGRTADANLRVAAHSLAELRRLDIGARKGEKWQGEKIPTLAEVLAIIPAGKIFFIECKCGKEIIPPLRRLFAASAMTPVELRFLAFDAPLLAALKTEFPDHQVLSKCGISPCGSHWPLATAPTGNFTDFVGLRRRWPFLGGPSPARHRVCPEIAHRGKGTAHLDG